MLMSKQIERVKCDSKQRNLKFIYNKKILSRVIAHTHTHTHIYIYICYNFTQYFFIKYEI